jgi:hypothetical protein
VLRVNDELVDVPARESGREPPPGGITRRSYAPSADGSVFMTLRAGGAAAVVEPVEAEQTARRRDERKGRVPAPAPARPLARLLDQRLKRFGVRGIIGARGAGVV